MTIITIQNLSTDTNTLAANTCMHMQIDKAFLVANKLFQAQYSYNTKYQNTLTYHCSHPKISSRWIS